MKTVVRYLIAFVLIILVMALILPLVGIPRGMLFPPTFVYSNATGRAEGYVTKVYRVASSNPFRVGMHNDFVDIQFRAPYEKPILFGDPKTDPNKLYKGSVPVTRENSAKFQVGMKVPVKYDKDYPEINGITLPYGGQHLIGPAFIISNWLIFFGIAIVLAHILSPFLERIMLRESY